MRILCFLGFDSFRRPVYTDDKTGNLVKDINPWEDKKPIIATTKSFDGEPENIVSDEFVFEPERMVWTVYDHQKANVTKLFDFIRSEQPMGEYADDVVTYEKLRALFTAVCLFHNLYGEKRRELLFYIWENAKPKFNTTSEYLEYMLEFLGGAK